MKSLKIEGYFKVNQIKKIYKNNNAIYEIIDERAIKLALNLVNYIPLLINHDKKNEIAKMSGYSDIRVEGNKVWFKANIENEEYINFINQNKINISIGFIPYKTQSYSVKNLSIRKIELLKLIEISLCNKKTVYDGRIIKITS